MPFDGKYYMLTCDATVNMTYDTLVFYRMYIDSVISRDPYIGIKSTYVQNRHFK
jgi:hypothetical protein